MNTAANSIINMLLGNPDSPQVAGNPLGVSQIASVPKPAPIKQSDSGQAPGAATSKNPVDFGEFVSRLLAPMDQSTGTEGAIHAGLRTYLTAKNPELAKEMEQDIQSRQQVWQRAQDASTEMTRLSNEHAFQQSLQTQAEGSRSALADKELTARNNERINTQTFEANQNTLNRSSTAILEGNREANAIKIEGMRTNASIKKLEESLTAKLTTAQMSAYNAAAKQYDAMHSTAGIPNADYSTTDRLAFANEAASGSPAGTNTPTGNNTAGKKPTDYSTLDAGTSIRSASGLTYTSAGEYRDQLAGKGPAKEYWDPERKYPTTGPKPKK